MSTVSVRRAFVGGIVGLACAIVPGICSAYTARDFLKYYSAAAKAMVPQLDIFGCRTSDAVKPTGKKKIECELVLSKALLTVYEIEGTFDGARLVFDDAQFGQPGWFMEAAGMFLRAAREAKENAFFSSEGHLLVTSNLLRASAKNNWAETCVDDQKAAARFCVGAKKDGAIFKYTITRLSEKGR